MDYGFDQPTPEHDDYNIPVKKKKNRLFIFGIILSVIITLAIFIGIATLVLNGVKFIFVDGTVQLNVSDRVVDVNDEGMTIPNAVAAVEGSVVAIGYTEECGNGSGVIISKDGYIVTNCHVVSGYERVYVALNDGKVYLGDVLASDEQTDLAVVKINCGYELMPAVFGDSDKARKGESVIAIGNPTGELKGSVSSGIISHNNRTTSIEGYVMELIQIDASVNPGNSGGGLFNVYGELIGIVNAKIVATTVESIGFAIPSNHVYSVISDLLTYGYVTGRPHVGLMMKVVQTPTYGGYVTEYIVTESKYCKDIKSGDKILSVGGKNIGEYTSQQLLYGYSIGDEIEVVLVRDSKTIVVKVVLQEYKP